MRKTQVFTRVLTPASDCERGSPERTSASEAAAEFRRAPVAFFRDGEAGEPPARPSAWEALRPRCLIVKLKLSFWALEKI